MPVNTPHRSYEASIDKWSRARDCFEGSDAVKVAGVKYLPPLDSHNIDHLRYDAYRKRALFYNATGRTVEGLAGFIFQKPPTFELPEKFEDHVTDITLAGVDATTFALWMAREILLTGRFGLMVDMLKEPKVSGDLLRPYWVGFRAEDIVSWRTEKREGDPSTVTRVVLREMEEETDPKDPFAFKEIEQYRVLELTDEGYQQTIWRKPDRSDKWSQYGEVIVPTRREEPLSFIPFVFVGPTSLSADVAKAPLIDMVDVNLSHYRTMADLEHGRHFTALPTPWVSGMRESDEDLYIGSGTAWDLGQGGSAGMLEFSGAGLSALVTAEQEKRKMMAVLGARLLEDQPATAETATAVLMRHSGEGATLRTMTGTIEKALNQALRWHVWWLSTEPTPNDVDVTAELNREFFMLRMNPQEVQAQLQLLQAESISYETFYHNLTMGGWTRPGVDYEEEREAIQREGGGTRPDEAANELKPKPDEEGGGSEEGLLVKPGEEKAAGPGLKAGDVVVHDEGPWKIVKRNGKYWVIRADSGKVMHKEGYKTKKEATKYMTALRMHAHD